MEDEDQSLTTSKTKVIVKLKKKACVCLRESQMNDYNNFVWNLKHFRTSDGRMMIDEEEEREDVFKVENQIISMHLEGKYHKEMQESYYYFLLQATFEKKTPSQLKSIFD